MRRVGAVEGSGLFLEGVGRGVDFARGVRGPHCSADEGVTGGVEGGTLLGGVGGTWHVRPVRGSGDGLVRRSDC